MSLAPVTCPKCHKLSNWNKLSTTKEKGYSYSKGIVGSALLGPVGAVAGINGKTKSTSTTYVCGHCGYIYTCN